MRRLAIETVTPGMWAYPEFLSIGSIRITRACRDEHWPVAPRRCQIGEDGQQVRRQSR